MPRKAITQSSNVPAAIAEITSYCDRENIRILGLSRCVGVSQSALARFVAGERKTVTSVARKCLLYIQEDKRHKQHIEVVEGIPGEVAIERAALSLWDGDPATAKFLALFLETLKPAVKVALATFKGTKVT